MVYNEKHVSTVIFASPRPMRPGAASINYTSRRLVAHSFVKQSPPRSFKWRTSHDRSRLFLSRWRTKSSKFTAKKRLSNLTHQPVNSAICSDALTSLEIDLWQILIRAIEIGVSRSINASQQTDNIRIVDVRIIRIVSPFVHRHDPCRCRNVTQGQASSTTTGSIGIRTVENIR